MKIILSDLAKIEFKKLSKKHKRNVLLDLDFLIDDIKNDNLGDRIQGLPVPVYKARIKNLSSNKGKSGGFRVIYHLKIDAMLFVLSFYSKSEKEDVSKKAILQSLKQLGLTK